MKDLLPLLLWKNKGLRKSFIVQMWRLSLVITSARMCVLSGQILCNLKPCAIVCPHMGKTPGIVHGYHAVLRICAFLMGSTVPHCSVGEAGRLATDCGFPCDSLAGTCNSSAPMLLSSLLNIAESTFQLRKQTQPTNNKTPPKTIHTWILYITILKSLI